MEDQRRSGEPHTEGVAHSTKLGDLVWVPLTKPGPHCSPSRPTIGPRSHASDATHTSPTVEQVMMTRHTPSTKPDDPHSTSHGRSRPIVAPHPHKRSNRHRPHGRASNDDPTPFAKGRTGAYPGPHNEISEGRNATKGGLSG